MPQSTVHISTNEQREFYYNSLIKKIAQFDRYIASAVNDTGIQAHSLIDIKRYLKEAISFKNMFDIKTATFTLTRDDVDLLTRILNSSA